MQKNLTSNLVIFVPTKLELKSILGVATDDLTAKYRGIDIVISGIGKTNTAIATTKYFMQHAKQHALMIGICGAYHGFANVGDVYSITHDYFVDEASLDNYSTLTTITEKGFAIAKDNRAEFHAIEGFKTCASNTVSFIPCVDDISNLYQAKTGACVENMEGAAFGVSLLGFDVKGYQLRGVSNFCGAKDNQAWDVKKACKAIKQSVDEIIDRNYI